MNTDTFNILRGILESFSESATIAAITLPPEGMGDARVYVTTVNADGNAVTWTSNDGYEWRPRVRPSPEQEGH